MTCTCPPICDDPERPWSLPCPDHGMFRAWAAPDGDREEQGQVDGCDLVRFGEGGDEVTRD